MRRRRRASRLALRHRTHRRRPAAAAGVGDIPEARGSCPARPSGCPAPGPAAPVPVSMTTLDRLSSLISIALFFFSSATKLSIAFVRVSRNSRCWIWRFTSASGRLKPGRFWVSRMTAQPLSVLIGGATSPTSASLNAASTIGFGYRVDSLSKNPRSPPRCLASSSSEYFVTMSLNCLPSGGGRQRRLGQRLRFGVGLVGLALLLDHHLADPHLVLLVELGGMLLVVLLDVRVGHVLDLQLRLEVFLQKLRDHLLLHHPHHLGILVVAAPLGLVGHDLEPNQAVEELLLLLVGRVARAHERRLLVDALLDIPDRDDRVIDLGHHLRRIAAAAAFALPLFFLQAGRESASRPSRRAGKIEPADGWGFASARDYTPWEQIQRVWPCP